MSQDYDFLTHTLSGNSPSESFPEIQGLFEAVLSNNLGATAPATTFPGMPWFDSNANAYKVRNSADTAWITLFTFGGAGGPRLGAELSAYYDDVPNATKMLFYQGAAPTGWTQDTTVNDRVLRVVSGAGGGTGGSWTISGISVLGHTLTTTEIPSHSHNDGTLSTSSNGAHNHSLKYNGNNAQAGSTDSFSGGTNGAFRSSPQSNITNPINATGNHSHDVTGNTGNTGGGGAHSHGISHNGGWRPSYIDTIVATRSK